MKNNKFRPLAGLMFEKIAHRIGARVVMEPKWGIVGQITFKNGRRRYVRYSSIDLNTMGASEIAKDKDYANFFMEKMGYPVIPGKTFFSKRWAKAIGSKDSIEAAYKYAKKIGFPVIVKPNSGSQGSGVCLVSNKRQLERALRKVFKDDRVAIVQTVVSGHDYRIVVLDNEVISAYERIPLSVAGDGHSNILKLLKKKQRDFVASSRDTILKLNDPRIKEKLFRQKLNFRSIIAKGERVFLLDNANLSTGGDSIDVTERMRAEWKKIAIRLTKDMGLRLCGVDLMISQGIERGPSDGQYWVIEVNSAPGLDHYARSGKVQEKIVEDLYLKVLKGME